MGRQSVGVVHFFQEDDMTCSTCGADINGKRGSYVWAFMEAVTKGKSTDRITFRGCASCVREGKFTVALQSAARSTMTVQA